MSASIEIPSRSTARRGNGKRPITDNNQATTSPTASAIASSSSAMTTGTGGQAEVMSGSSPALSSSTFTSSSTANSGSPRSSHHRRQSSYLNSYMSHQDHVVLNVSNNPETVRLLSYVRSGQGFDWNGDLFLPGGSGSGGSPYARELVGGVGGGGGDELAILDQCVPVHEIHLDDDEDMA